MTGPWSSAQWSLAARCTSYCACGEAREDSELFCVAQVRHLDELAVEAFTPAADLYFMSGSALLSLISMLQVKLLVLLQI